MIQPSAQPSSVSRYRLQCLDRCRKLGWGLCLGSSATVYSTYGVRWEVRLDGKFCLSLVVCKYEELSYDSYLWPDNSHYCGLGCPSTINYISVALCPPSTKANNRPMKSLLCVQDKNWDRQLFVNSCHLNGWSGDWLIQQDNTIYNIRVSMSTVEWDDNKIETRMMWWILYIVFVSSLFECEDIKTDRKIKVGA